MKKKEISESQYAILDALRYNGNKDAERELCQIEEKSLKDLMKKKSKAKNKIAKSKLECPWCDAPEYGINDNCVNEMLCGSFYNDTRDLWSQSDECRLRIELTKREERLRDFSERFQKLLDVVKKCITNSGEFDSDLICVKRKWFEELEKRYKEERGG